MSISSNGNDAESKFIEQNVSEKKSSKNVHKEDGIQIERDADLDTKCKELVYPYVEGLILFIVGFSFAASFYESLYQVANIVLLTSVFSFMLTISLYISFREKYFSFSSLRSDDVSITLEVPPNRCLAQRHFTIIPFEELAVIRLAYVRYEFIRVDGRVHDLDSDTGNVLDFNNALKAYHHYCTSQLHQTVPLRYPPLLDKLISEESDMSDILIPSNQIRDRKLNIIRRHPEILGLISIVFFSFIFLYDLILGRGFSFGTILMVFWSIVFYAGISNIFPHFKDSIQFFPRDLSQDERIFRLYWIFIARSDLFEKVFPLIRWGRIRRKNYKEPIASQPLLMEKILKIVNGYWGEYAQYDNKLFDKLEQPQTEH